MIQPKMYTEREFIKAQRASFREGATWRFDEALSRGRRWEALDPEEYDGEIDFRYPLPKIRKLRERLSDTGQRCRWSPTTERFEYLVVPLGTWNEMGLSSRKWVVDNLEMLADLKANPWEEVDAP